MLHGCRRKLDCIRETKMDISVWASNRGTLWGPESEMNQSGLQPGELPLVPEKEGSYGPTFSQGFSVSRPSERG